MPTITAKQISKAHDLLAGAGWYHNGELGDYVHYKHMNSELAHYYITLHKPTLTMIIHKAGPSRGLSYQGLSAIRSGLKEFAKIEVATKEAKTATKTVPVTKVASGKVMTLGELKETLCPHGMDYDVCPIHNAPQMEDVNNLSDFKVESHGNYFALTAVATDTDDTSRVASVTICNAHSAEMAEMIKSALTIYKRAALALIYLEDGAPNSALRALKGGR